MNWNWKWKRNLLYDWPSNGNGTDDRGEGDGGDQGLDGGGALGDQGQESDKEQEKALENKEVFETKTMMEEKWKWSRHGSVRLAANGQIKDKRSNTAVHWKEFQHEERAVDHWPRLGAVLEKCCPCASVSVCLPENRCIKDKYTDWVPRAQSNRNQAEISCNIGGS